MLYGELAELPVGGVPLRTPVVALKVNQVGSVPAETVTAGMPVAVTVNEPCVPAVKVVLGALVNAGAVSTTRVKLWVALDPIPLAAVRVIG
jgi:hypothetical protein